VLAVVPAVAGGPDAGIRKGVVDPGDQLVGVGAVELRECMLGDLREAIVTGGVTGQNDARTNIHGTDPARKGYELTCRAA
jgi:hypothetical protein